MVGLTFDRLVPGARDVYVGPEVRHERGVEALSSLAAVLQVSGQQVDPDETIQCWVGADFLASVGGVFELVEPVRP